MDSVNHVVLVFELMEGGDLLNYMLSQRKTDSTSHNGTDKEMTEDERLSLSDEDAKLVFQQLLHAISYAHNQHICHRDLKLENILLKGKTLQVVKVGDFGLSDFYRPGSTAKTEVGTLAFLAPEVFRGTANSGPPLDVWALGVVLFTMLNGRLPFDGESKVSTKNS
jgi:serine/threonine protein kinase